MDMETAKATTGDKKMTALEKLNKLAADVYAETLRVQKEFPTMAQGIALMAKHGARTIRDAIHAEAMTRVSA